MTAPALENLPHLAPTLTKNVKESTRYIQNVFTHHQISVKNVFFVNKVVFYCLQDGVITDATSLPIFRSAKSVRQVGLKATCPL